MAPQSGPAVAFALLLAGLVAGGALAEQAAPGEAWRSSPFHGVPNAATGRTIPCVCVFRGKEYRLGDAVCMNTHVGTVVTRCDLNLNNTTWVPTTEPCTVSLRSTVRYACTPPVTMSYRPG